MVRQAMECCHILIIQINCAASFMAFIYKHENTYHLRELPLCRLCNMACKIKTDYK